MQTAVPGGCPRFVTRNNLAVNMVTGRQPVNSCQSAVQDPGRGRLCKALQHRGRRKCVEEENADYKDHAIGATLPIRALAYHAEPGQCLRLVKNLQNVDGGC